MTGHRVNKDDLFNFFINKRWPWGCLLFFLLSCNNAHDKNYAADFQRIDSARALVKSGDLIFRDGTDDVSRAARSFNRIDTSFSHCGLVLVENDTPFVYHMLGGQYNPSQKLRRDPIDSFCTPPEADRFAIYRYDLSPVQTDTLASVIHYYYGIGLRFDLYFNILTDDRMYCSEFVFKCLDRALSGALHQEIKARKWPYGISPDDLFLNSRSRLIKRVDFIE